MKVINKEATFSSKPKQISEAANIILKQVFGELNMVKLVVLGDIEISFNIGENFKRKNLKKVVLEKKKTNRKDKENELKKYFTEFDFIVIGYKNESMIIKSQFIKECIKKRKHKPIFLIDCAIPGNVDQDVSKINNCFVFDLNDLEQFYSRWDLDSKHNLDSIPIDHEVDLQLSSFYKEMRLSLSQKTTFERFLKKSLSDNTGLKFKDHLKDFFKTFGKNNE